MTLTLDQSPTTIISDEIQMNHALVTKHHRSFISSRQYQKRIDATAAQSEIAADLARLKSAIQNMSRVCLERLTGLVDEARCIENDLKGVDGALQVIKDSAGAASLKECSGAGAGAPRAQAPPVAPAACYGPPRVGFPPDARLINAAVLAGVGDSLAAPDGRPIILRIAPGRPRIEPWSRPQDFFLAAGGGPPPERTSFDDLCRVI